MPAETPGTLLALWRRTHDRGTGRAGLVLLAAVVVLGLAVPLLDRHDPARIGPTRALEGPSGEFPLGTDHLGRCLLSRLAHGARWSVGSSLLATALVVALGTGLGAAAGQFGGRTDAVVMRSADVLLAVPGFLLALAVVGSWGSSLTHALLALVGIWWARYARIVRGLALSLRERPFVLAARALGASESRILFRHVVPNLLPPVLVLATVEVGEILLALSALSFLGLGAQPPTPEWGGMLNEARPFLTQAPALLLLPGAAISVTAIALNLVGDAMRDALDPRLAASP